MTQDPVAIIPARAGSKGLPGKNLLTLCGKPLLAWTVEAAIASRSFFRVVVSTEDPETGRVAVSLGAELVDRPLALAQDDSSVIDVVLHAVDSLGVPRDSTRIVALLQPTSPLRDAEDIREALRLFQASDAASLVSVAPCSHPPQWALKLDDGKLRPAYGQEMLEMRRQELTPLYAPNGAIYLTRVRDLIRTRSFFMGGVLAYAMPAERSVDIDSELDLAVASALAAQRGAKR
jgi:CMP-N-acetylneuraminic acid synthetase